MPRLRCKLPNQLPLRPPIPFAKRMNRIDLPQIEGRPRRKLLWVQVAQAIFPSQLLQRIRQRPGDMQRRAKHRITLRDIDDPKLPRPRKHILKKIPVNAAQVRNVELAREALILQFAAAFRGKRRLQDLQFRVVD